MSHPVAVFINQELVEVPTHFGIVYAVQGFVTQPLVYFMTAASVGFHLAHHLERNAVILGTKALYLSFASRLLESEIIRWKPKNDKIFTAVALVQLLQFFILWGVPTFRSNIDN